MQNHCYLFNVQCDLASWLTQLMKQDRWQQKPWQDTRNTYYDTFDWRLYRKKSTLAQSEKDQCPKLSFCACDGDLLASSEHSEKPGFVWDLPFGQLRQQLEPLIKMRRLLPQVTVCCHQQDLALLNSDGKTVLRMRVYSDRRAIDPLGAQKPLSAYLQILPVLGYRSAIRRIAGLLSSDSCLQPAVLDPLADALATLGRRPADYSSKLVLKLHPNQTAQQALRAILLQLLTTLRTNVSGTCKDLDSEFLHDLRVSVRRTRSALSQLKGLLPPDELAPFREDFTWLGNITGPTRDLDVYLLKFADYCQRLPETHRPDLTAFRRFLELRQTEAQQTLASQLSSSRVNNLLTEWQTLLAQDRDQCPALPDANRPVKEIADSRIWKLFKRCIKEGRAITPSCPAENLHELRKTCKKLRYLLEFFKSLYPANAITVLIKVLKGLQDNLGDFNDYEVQSQAMYAFGIEMAEKNMAPPSTLIAMGMLTENLHQQQQQTRQEFYRHFAEFSEDQNRQFFRQLFGQSKVKGVSKP